MNPYITIKKVDGNNSIFYLYQADITIANQLRVIMMDRVPTMAIDVVDVTKNETVLTDEALIQRLGLVPIESQLVDQYSFPEDCDCSDRCSKCSAVINLIIKSNPEGPIKYRKLTSLDLSPIGSVQPVKHIISGQEEGVDLILISNHQNIKMRCLAIKGRGSQHAKWTPVCKVVYWPDKTDTSRIYFEVETVGSLTIHELLKSACQILTAERAKVDQIVKITIRE